MVLQKTQYIVALSSCVTVNTTVFSMQGTRIQKRILCIAPCVYLSLLIIACNNNAIINFFTFKCGYVQREVEIICFKHATAGNVLLCSMQLNLLSIEC